MLLFAAPALITSAQAAKPAVAKSTAALHAELGREAVQRLYKAATDPDRETRVIVAEGWGRLGNRGAVPLLKKTINDEDPDVRTASAGSLYQLGEIQGLTALIDEIKPFVQKQTSSPAEELKQMARDAARARAVLKLAEVGKEAGRNAIAGARSDPSGVVRDAAVAALARLGEGDASVFVDALKDSDEAVRAAAARSIGQIGKDGADALRKVLASDTSLSARAEAAYALGAFEDSASASALESALADKSARVRLAAARALARRADGGSTAALGRLLEKAPKPEFGLLAAAALAERGAPVDESLAELTLAQNDPELKTLALRVLGRSTRPETLDLLVKAMREDSLARTRANAALALVDRLRREARR